MTPKELLNERTRLKTEIKNLNAQLTEVETQLIQYLEQAEVESVTVEGHRISVSSRTYYSPENWDSVFAWIVKTNSPFILQKRLNNSIVADLIEAGEEIPTVKPFTKEQLNIRRVK